MDRFTRLAATIERSEGFIIPRINLPDHTGPCRMAHPEQQATCTVPHFTVPCFHHGTMAVIVGNLCFSAKVFQVRRLSVFLIYVFHKFPLSPMQIMIIPNITDRPGIFHIHHSQNRFFRRDGSRTLLRIEPMCPVTIIIYRILMIVPWTAWS